MTRSPRLWLPLAAALILLASCAEEFAPCPDIGVGVVEGRITVAGEPWPLQIEAQSVDDPVGSSRIRTMADSSGVYRLELPTGDYRIMVEPEGGDLRRYQVDESSVVEVGALPSRLDFDLGRVRGTLTLPEFLAEATIRVDLEGESLHYESLSIEAVGGVLDYDLKGVKPGRYEISIDPLYTGYYDVGVPQGPAHPDSVFLQVTAAETRRDFDYTQTACTIGGTVGGAWLGSEAPPPTIGIHSPVSGRLVSLPAEADGRWSASLLLPQTFFVSVAFSSSSFYLGGGDSQTATRYEPVAGQELLGLDCAPAGFRLALEDPYPSDSGFDFSYEVVDAAGNWADSGGSRDATAWVLGLEPGAYRVLIHGHCGEDPWIPFWYGSDGTASGAALVELADGELVDLEFPVVQGAELSGRVTWPDGTPVARGSIRLVPETEDMGWEQNSLSLYQGRFLIRGVPDGRFRLRASLSYWGTPWWYPGVAAEEDASWIQVEDLQDVGGLDWILPAGLGEES